MRARRGWIASAPPLSGLIALLAGCGGVREDAGPYRHVVLISLDTTRADHLGCYGGETVRTPNIDALAAEGVLFRDVTSPVPTTLAAHTSIMTGLTARSHGVVRNGFMVHADNHMLAEVLGDAGFLCGAVLGSWALASDFAFDQGFHHFDDDFDLEFHPRSYDQNQRRAEHVTDAALAFVDSAAQGERLFLFAHYFDAHAPYDPPPPYDSMYGREGWRREGTQADVDEAARVHQRAILDTDSVPGLAGVFQQGLSSELVHGAGRAPLGFDDELAALYAGEVGYLDQQVGRLLDGLRDRGLLDETIVILTGDHGETFWEHGDVWNHGLWLYDTTLRVPLIVRLPGADTAGLVIDGPVSTIDVMPTLLELLELSAPEPLEGRSLAAALAGAVAPHRPIFSEATQPVGLPLPDGAWGNDPLPKSVRSGPWKYVFAPYLGLEELYHVGRDPLERRNLLIRPNPTTEARRAELSGELQDWLRARHPRPSQFNQEQLREVERRLRELGYAEGSPDD